MTASRPAEPDPELVPPTGRAVQSIFWDVIERWHARESEIGDWESALHAVSVRRPVGWAALTERLQLINTFQWHEEDRSRDPAADDALLAAVKRSIDASNARRVQTVDQLDALLVRGFAAADCLAPSAPVPSESPGSIIDRLTVLALKIYHTREALAEVKRRADSAASARGLHERLSLLTEQHADLTECLDRLLEDVRRRRVRLKLYRQIKIYRTPGPDTARDEPR
jgi:hypothetical protein